MIYFFRICIPLHTIIYKDCLHNTEEKYMSSEDNSLHNHHSH